MRLVEAPPGYEVSVVPDSLYLRNGESASYEVTITNVTAPPGEWQFGALTWVSDKERDVRVPIAVNAVAIVAPPQVDGTGADGSAEFDITFGYNGDYTAQVHGLTDPNFPVALIETEDDPTDSFVFLGPGVEIALLPRSSTTPKNQSNSTTCAGSPFSVWNACVNTRYGSSIVGSFAGNTTSTSSFESLLVLDPTCVHEKFGQ